MVDSVQSTLDYYRANATSFANTTVNISFTHIQDIFLEYLQPGAEILDFGCGAGRDTKYFLSRGFQVRATDGCAELCTIASALTGIEVQQMNFEDLDCEKVFDGIWACASILHLPKDTLSSVLGKIQCALKPQGVLYTSFKYGDFAGFRHGRYFTDFTESSWPPFLESCCSLKIDRMWISSDARPDRKDEKWLNLILQNS